MWWAFNRSFTHSPIHYNALNLLVYSLWSLFFRRRCSPDGCVFVVCCHLTCRSCRAPFNVMMHIHIGRQFYLFMFTLYDLSMWCRNKAFNEFDSHPFTDLIFTQTAPWTDCCSIDFSHAQVSVWFMDFSFIHRIVFIMCLRKWCVHFKKNATFQIPKKYFVQQYDCNLHLEHSKKFVFALRQRSLYSQQK